MEIKKLISDAKECVRLAQLPDGPQTAQDCIQLAQALALIAIAESLNWMAEDKEAEYTREEMKIPDGPQAAQDFIQPAQAGEDITN